MLFAALTAPNGEVHAFEPNPKGAEMIRRSAARNGWSDLVCVHGVAVSDRSGRACLHLSPGEATMSSLIRHQWLDGSSQIEVDCVTLDEALAGLGQRPRLMKVDVEGWEPHVFAGARSILARWPPEFLLVEYSTSVDTRSLHEVLLQNGFQPGRIGQSGFEAREIPLPPPTRAMPLSPDFEAMNLLYRHAALPSSGADVDRAQAGRRA
jgi:FkbM family methyltransferase